MLRPTQASTTREYVAAIGGLPAVRKPFFRRFATRRSVQDVGAYDSPLVLKAQDLFQWLLGSEDDRARHTLGVVQRAHSLIGTIDPFDADLLLAGAWLHEIGNAKQARDTAFAPLDGARFLHRAGWPSRLCGLVAFHSGAYYLALDLGLGPALRAFRDEPGPVRDALTYADQTTGPFGEHLSIEHRMDEALRRHGPDSPHTRVHAQRAPYIRSAAERVHQRLGS
jgi:hypothetical protein